MASNHGEQSGVGKLTPEIASTRLDFPALWLPMTTIRGSSRSMCALSKSKLRYRIKSIIIENIPQRSKLTDKLYQLLRTLSIVARRQGLRCHDCTI